jgi:DNA helicase-2/ATP-dependent DNA helicase PcrA
MINWPQFQQIVIQNLGRNIQEDQNPPQNQAISAPTNESLFIVAGPGSGKTTVMVLKILKFILVDDVPPASGLVFLKRGKNKYISYFTFQKYYI